MKYVFTILMAFAIGFAVVSCTKDEVCDAGKTAGKLLAAQVAVQLDCKNVAAIEEDILVILQKTNICEKPPTTVTALGPIGDVICKPIVDALVAGLLTQVPTKYECSGSGKITDEIKAKLVAACAKAI